MTRSPIILLLALLLLTMGCKTPFNHPSIPFEEMEVPAPPDYSKISSWAAHPLKKDSAEAIPKGSNLQDLQANAPVDVFFIHPTILNTKEVWNADVSDAEMNHEVCKSTIRFQASLFNGVGRVFAPHYRQATYGTFGLSDQRQKVAPLMVAYSDVKSAFEYYLQNENHGRPIIIAGHSQGSLHGIRLLQEFFDGKPLADRLVAAYLPGWPIPVDTFKVLRQCESPEATGCVATWMTAQNGFVPSWLDTNRVLMGVNPVTWTTDNERAYVSVAKGAVLWKFDFRPEIVNPLQRNGLVWIDKPDVPGKMFYNEKNYHAGDFNLFWMDVRENAALRVKTYLEKHSK